VPAPVRPVSDAPASAPLPLAAPLARPCALLLGCDPPRLCAFVIWLLACPWGSPSSSGGFPCPGRRAPRFRQRAAWPPCASLGIGWFPPPPQCRAITASLAAFLARSPDLARGGRCAPLSFHAASGCAHPPSCRIVGSRFFFGCLRAVPRCHAFPGRFPARTPRTCRGVSRRQRSPPPAGARGAWAHRIARRIRMLVWCGLRAPTVCSSKQSAALASDRLLCVAWARAPPARSLPVAGPLALRLRRLVACSALRPVGCSGAPVHARRGLTRGLPRQHMAGGPAGAPLCTVAPHVLRAASAWRPSAVRVTPVLSALPLTLPLAPCRGPRRRARLPVRPSACWPRCRPTHRHTPPGSARSGVAGGRPAGLADLLPRPFGPACGPPLRGHVRLSAHRCCRRLRCGRRACGPVGGLPPRAGPPSTIGLYPCPPDPLPPLRPPPRAGWRRVPQACCTWILHRRFHLAQPQLAQLGPLAPRVYGCCFPPRPHGCPLARRAPRFGARVGMPALLPPWGSALPIPAPFHAASPVPGWCPLARRVGLPAARRVLPAWCGSTRACSAPVLDGLRGLPGLVAGLLPRSGRSGPSGALPPWLAVRQSDWGGLCHPPFGGGGGPGLSPRSPPPGGALARIRLVRRRCPDPSLRWHGIPHPSGASPGCCLAPPAVFSPFSCPCLAGRVLPALRNVRPAWPRTIRTPHRHPPHMRPCSASRSLHRPRCGRPLHRRDRPLPCAPLSLSRRPCALVALLRAGTPTPSSRAAAGSRACTIASSSSEPHRCPRDLGPPAVVVPSAVARRRPATGHTALFWLLRRALRAIGPPCAPSSRRPLAMHGCRPCPNRFSPRTGTKPAAFLGVFSTRGSFGPAPCDPTFREGANPLHTNLPFWPTVAA